MSDVLEAIYRVIQGGDQDEVARLTEKALAGGILTLQSSSISINNTKGKIGQCSLKSKI